MPQIKRLCCLLLVWWSPVYAVTDTTAQKPVARAVASSDLAAWSLGLIAVLGVFFFCIWAIRKFGGLNVSGGEKMRLLGGLSLGLREKVILVQVGKKQLVLGVTPGRIETLLVLEGEDCLLKESSLAMASETGFAQKLMQAITASPASNPNGPSQ